MGADGHFCNSPSSQDVISFFTRYGSWADRITDLVWLTDDLGQLKFTNQRWMDFTGIKIDQAAGRHWFEAISETDRARVESQVAELSRSGLRNVDLQVDIRDVHGDPQSFAVCLEPTLDDKGRFAGWLGIASSARTPQTDSADVRSGRQSSSEITEVLANNEVPDLHFRDLSDAMPQLVWIANSDGVVIYYSSQVTRYDGIMPTGSGDWNWQPVVHPSERQATINAWSEAVRTGRHYQCQHRIKMADGLYRWHLSRARKARNGYWFGTATDVHSLKIVQDELRVTTDRFRAAIEATDTTIFNQNADLQYTWIHNPSRGFLAEEIIGKSDSELLEFPEDAKVIESIKRSVLETGMPRCEEVGLRRGGRKEYYKLYVSPQKEGDGLVTGLTCAALNITVNKLTEIALRESEDRFRKTFEFAAMGVAHLDLNGSWLRANERYCEILGYSQQELLKLRFDQVTHPDDISADWELAEKLISNEIQRYSIEKRYIRKDGRIVPVILTVSMTRTSDGQPEYFLAVAEDITLRKQAEEQLKQQDRRKEEFLATLAHELRNPLAPIRTGLEVMKLARDNPSLLEETRAAMERQTKQLISIVDDLLDVSRISQGKLRLRKTLVNLDDVVQSALEACQPIIKSFSHEMLVATPDEAIFVQGDPNRLAQILANLITNAAKYTDKQGKISLKVQGTEHHVSISVSDNGIGIESDMLQQVFEMFTQVEGLADRGLQGLGIGLTLVKSLVELHDGTVTVESPGPGKGSTFTVNLPIARSLEPPEGASSMEPEELLRAEGKRVLVVDDNVAAATMMSVVVKMMGNEVRTAQDGLEAIRVAAEFRPHVVFMDIGMPKMNGYEAARAIRQESWGKYVQLVALTGWGQDADRVRTAEAGFDRHLVKPAEPQEIRKIIASLDGQN